MTEKQLTAVEVVVAAHEWATARAEFIVLPSDDPKAREALNQLSNAENALAVLVNRYAEFIVT